MGHITDDIHGCFMNISRQAVGHAQQGNLAAEGVRSLFLRCAAIRFTGLLELSASSRHLVVSFVAGEPLDAPELTALAGAWNEGSWQLLQRAVGLSGGLADGPSLEGTLAEISPHDLLRHCEEQRFTCDVEFTRGDGQRAMLGVSMGMIESAEVNGRPDGAALAEAASWSAGRYRLQLAPIFDAGLDAGFGAAASPTSATGTSDSTAAAKAPSLFGDDLTTVASAPVADPSPRPAPSNPVVPSLLGSRVAGGPGLGAGLAGSRGPSSPFPPSLGRRTPIGVAAVKAVPSGLSSPLMKPFAPRSVAAAALPFPAIAPVAAAVAAPVIAPVVAPAPGPDLDSGWGDVPVESDAPSSGPTRTTERSVAIPPPAEAVTVPALVPERPPLVAEPTHLGASPSAPEPPAEPVKPSRPSFSGLHPLLSSTPPEAGSIEAAIAAGGEAAFWFSSPTPGLTADPMSEAGSSHLPEPQYLSTTGDHPRATASKQKASMSSQNDQFEEEARYPTAGRPTAKGILFAVGLTAFAAVAGVLVALSLPRGTAMPETPPAADSAPGKAAAPVAGAAGNGASPTTPPVAAGAVPVPAAPIPAPAAVAKPPASAEGQALIASARKAAIEGKKKDALKEFKAAYKLNPNDPAFAIYVPMALGKTGRGGLVLDGAGDVVVDGHTFRAPSKLVVAAGPHTVVVNGKSDDVVVEKDGTSHVGGAAPAPSAVAPGAPAPVAAAVAPTDPAGKTAKVAKHHKHHRAHGH